MLQKKKTKLNSAVTLKKKLDTVFSQYIRLRDMIPGTTVFRCISCGFIKPIDQADCGHYINRQHMSTRFSEVNCNAQCRSCNRFDEGNIQGYRRGLIRKYGENHVLILESKKKDVRQYTAFEYQALIEHYKQEVKRLLKEKNLDIKCLTK
jgi:hypothetical protein|nr:MAG TPA: NinG recombination protein [Caudoviricetes sp.]